MSRRNLAAWWVAILLVADLCGSLTEGQTTAESNSSAALAAAREVVKKAGNCGLVTVDEAGQPRVRTMDPFPPDENWRVILATNSSTRKVEEIRNNPHVALYYFDPDSPGYVTLMGRARLVDDQESKDKYWKETWKAYYRDENRGDDYLLIEVAPSKLEVMSISHGIAADPLGWKPAVVKFGN